MNKVLLPTDFSDNAYNAIKFAMNLFKNQATTFYLLNCFTPAAYYAGTTQVSSYSALHLEGAVAKASQKQLDQLEEKIKAEFSNPNHVIVKISAFNLLVNEMMDLQETHNIDLVIMGTKGATGAKEIFIGTQTMLVIKNLKCPVIAVPVNFEYEEPKEVLFPTDYKFDVENQFLPMFQELAEEHHARVNILNVYYGHELSEEQMTKKEFLDAIFDITAHVFHSVENVDIPEAVETFQLKYNINFLVMIHNEHSFFENLLFTPVINQLVYHTCVPFMVIPSEKRLRG